MDSLLSKVTDKLEHLTTKLICHYVQKSFFCESTVSKAGYFALFLRNLRDELVYKYT